MLHFQLGFYDSYDDDGRDKSAAKDSKNRQVQLSGGITNIIGKRLAEERILASPVHSDFAIRWSDIIKLGLPKEERESLVKKYPLPKNCTFLDAPKLNAEVDRAINVIARNRDKRIIEKQQKLAACVASIGKTIKTLVDREMVTDIRIIENLSDACRLIVDSIHDERTIRRSVILANGNMPSKNILGKTNTDEFLFGKALSDDSKSEKIINQLADQFKIKKATQPLKNTKNAESLTRQYNKMTTTSGGQKSLHKYQNYRQMSRQAESYYKSSTPRSEELEQAIHEISLENTVKGYKIPFESTPTQSKQNCKDEFCLEEMNIATAIADLIDKGIVIECEPTLDQFLSGFFLVQIPDKSYKLDQGFANFRTLLR